MWVGDESFRSLYGRWELWVRLGDPGAVRVGLRCGRWSRWCGCEVQGVWTGALFLYILTRRLPGPHD
jgi:hypothetical protein